MKSRLTWVGKVSHHKERGKMERIKWLHEWDVLGTEDLRELSFLLEQEAIHTGKGVEERWRLWLHVGKSSISMQTPPMCKCMNPQDNPVHTEELSAPVTWDTCHFISLYFNHVYIYVICDISQHCKHKLTWLYFLVFFFFFKLNFFLQPASYQSIL